MTGGAQPGRRRDPQRASSLAAEAQANDGYAVRSADAIACGGRLDVEIAAMSPLGDGIARPAGLEIRVQGAMPGERVTVRVEHRSRQVERAWARLETLREPLPSRRLPPCPRQGTCTGCPLMVVDEPTQRRLKRQMLRDSFGIEVDRFVHREGAELGYRWSSKRVVGSSQRGPAVGSYRRGTHRIASMAGCLVEHRLVSRCGDELEQALRTARARGSSQRRAQPLPLKAAWIRTDGRQACLLGLVGTGEPSLPVTELVATLREPTGISWSLVAGQSADGLRGEGTRLLRGQDRIEVTMAGVTVAVGAMGFLQPNPAVAELAYRDLLVTEEGDAVSGRVALDLYAGAGATTALLRERFDRVVACDEHPGSAAGSEVSAMRAEELLEREVAAGRAVDLVVADPPRAGLSEAALRSVAALRPRRIHLMSCSGASLARDVSRLTGPEGAYELAGCRAYDTLPQTPHVELVAWLVRRSASSPRR